MNLRTLLAAALAALPLAALADASFDFTDAAGNAISSLAVGGVGSTFDVYIRYTTDLSHDGANVFLGFDRTTTWGMGATPLDGFFDVDGGLNDAVVVQSPDLGFALGSALTSVALAGGAGDDRAVRPFGLDIPLSVPFGSGKTVASAANAPLLKVSLRNLGFSTGSYGLTLFDGGEDAGFSYTSYLLSGFDAVRPGSRLLTLQAVPEPGSVAALGLGVAAALRRRKRI